MRVTERTQHQSEQPARGVLLAVLFAVLAVGLVGAFGTVDQDGSAIEAVSPVGGDESEAVDHLRALSAAARAPAFSLAPRPVAPAPLGPTAARGYTDDIGRLEGEIAEPPKRVLSVAPVTVPPPPVTAATTTTVIIEATPEETTTSVVEPSESSITVPTTGTGSTDTTQPAADGSGTTGISGDGETAATAPTTTTTVAAPAPTAHPDGWVDSGNGVYLPAVLLSIRFCESRDNYTAANPSSSARGAYQFLTGSWAAYGHADRYGVARADLASRAQQDEAALITWQRDGSRPWNASKRCWS